MNNEQQYQMIYQKIMSLPDVDISIGVELVKMNLAGEITDEIFTSLMKMLDGREKVTTACPVCSGLMTHQAKGAVVSHMACVMESSKHLRVK